MRIAVTGSTGLIGTALLPALRERGHQAVSINRGPARRGALSWDVETGRIDDLSGVDGVVHLAGIGIGDRRWNAAHKQAILDSRVTGTRLVVEAMAGADPTPSVLVSASAVGYYGDRGDAELDEDSGRGTGFLADVCVRWEEEADGAPDSGIRVVKTRSGIVLSKEGGALARMLLPFKLGLGGRLGPGTQWMSWISLPDQVRGIIHLLESDVSGPVNMVAPGPVTNADFTKALGAALHRPTILPTPLWPVKARFGSELVEGMLLSSLRVAGSRLVKSGYQFRHPDLPSALRAVLAG